MMGELNEIYMFSDLVRQHGVAAGEREVEGHALRCLYGCAYGKGGGGVGQNVPTGQPMRGIGRLTEETT